MKTVVVVALAFCLSVAAFASGEDQNEGPYPDKWGAKGFVMEMPETQVYTGTFRMEEDAYPAILTDEGKLYYLMLPDMIDGDNLPPDEGAALTIEAFKSPFSPVHLMIVSAEVNGEEIDMAWFDEGSGFWEKGREYSAPWKGGKGRYRGGHHWGYGWGEHGPWGRPGYSGGYGYGAYGPWGKPGCYRGGYGAYGPWDMPGWDYPEE